MAPNGPRREGAGPTKAATESALDRTDRGPETRCPQGHSPTPLPAGPPPPSSTGGFQAWPWPPGQGPCPLGDQEPRSERVGTQLTWGRARIHTAAPSRPRHRLAQASSHVRGPAPGVGGTRHPLSRVWALVSDLTDSAGTQSPDRGQHSREGAPPGPGEEPGL